MNSAPMLTKFKNKDVLVNRRAMVVFIIITWLTTRATTLVSFKFYVLFKKFYLKFYFNIELPQGVVDFE